jgi:hypothetical protein
MLDHAETKRLVATLIASVALHFISLTFIPRGQPGIGGPLSPATQSARLEVRIAALIDTLALSPQSPASIGVEPSQAVKNPLDLNTTVKPSDLVRLGLPMHEETGPPYPPPLPLYLPASLLEYPAQPLTSLDEKLAGLEGIVGAGRMVFSLLINEDGGIDEVLDEYSSLGSDSIATVKELLGGLRFQPGIKEGKPVKSCARIEVNFSYSVY